MNVQIHPLRAVGACLALIGVASGGIAQLRLRVFDSGADFNPTRIGQAGMIAGQDGTHSFAFDREFGLSSIPAFPTKVQIWAEDVNVSGRVVGSGYRRVGQSSILTAFIWDRGGGTQMIADFGGAASMAFGLNDLGEVVGEYGGDFSTAFLWRPDGSWTALPAKYGGQCSGYKINNIGEVLGFTQITGSTTTVVWRPDGTIIDLGQMSPQYANYAFDLNNNGWVCGRTFGPLGSTGYLWNPSTETYTAIFNPYSPGSFIDATGLNDQNVIIGSLIISGVGWKGYIRYPNGQITLLNSLLDTASQGWDVQEAWDINNKGQISAAAVKNGQRRGVLLQPIKDRAPISIGR